MQRIHYIVLFSALLLLLAMYVGCETKASSVKEISRTRSLVLESTTLEVLEKNASDALDAATLLRVQNLKQEMEVEANLEKKAELARELSSLWYASGFSAIAGGYAEKVAGWIPSATTWSIAGTTFGQVLATEKVGKVRDFAVAHAQTAFENAISFAPDDWTHKLNLALILTDAPPADNPMKGVKMLLDLDRSYPDNSRILFHLGRLAIQTGQYEKAVERLEKSLSLDAKQPKIYCLLETAYRETKRLDLAASASNRCRLIEN